MIELARALAKLDDVYRVDLLTRLIEDPNVSEDYGKAEECLYKKEQEKSGAYIVRLKCGDPKRYIP